MGSKVLLVDDDINLLEALSSVLRKFDVDTESNPVTALKRIEEHDYAVIVSDMKMPEMDGLDFLRAVSYASPETIRIMLTGHGDLETAMSAINESRIYRFLSKPVDSSDMRVIIADALREHEIQMEEKRLRDSAVKDALTGLPNRLLFDDRCQVSYNQSERHCNCIAAFFIDLDGFKLVNDTYGHDAGDVVLKIVAERLINRVRSQDTVARFGGDEFVVLLSDISNEEKDDVELVAADLIKEIVAPIEWNDKTLSIGASIGICLSCCGEMTIENMLTQADEAMYVAKRKGGNVFHRAN